MRDKPKKGERWRHCKGGQYEIICLALHSEDKSEQVVYMNVLTFEVWVRPLFDFMSRHSNGDIRFTRKD